ncbi:glycoside hydrolase family 2 protein [Salinimicrobium terrae]|uniref:glycoside hydrolase family 2 protein n=1 Tax=Salinimicrobium terrae TaxID=470866 RepID=UPI0003FAAC80|nr:glycoside hydrolase family 2 TIM barrel-domain containing protein [Salinimicrobium terrae]
MKHLFICVSLIFTTISSISVSAQTLIQNVENREKLNLNGRWNYIVDPYRMGYLDYRQEPFDESPSGKGGFYENLNEGNAPGRIEYNFDLSPTLKVPGDWNSQEENLELYEGTLWYKRDFTIFPDEDNRYFIHFGAVNYEAHVYLNGEKLGIHKGGFTPFQFEVTNNLQDGENFLVVMVDNTRKQDEVPTVNTDWWNYGGITRDVNLVITPATFISDYKVQLADNIPNLIKGHIQLDGDSGKNSVEVEIPELEIRKVFDTDASGKVEFEVPVDDVRYWSPMDPKLYTVTISLENESISDQIGFRTIETVGKNILLNDKSIFLKGISIHDENPLIEGRLRTEGDMRMMLQWAKDLGCNFVRLAHYTHNETMIRLADEMGLMVWAEIPVYWTISWENEATYRNAESQLITTIERDKNRASVIIWSVGNETPVTEARNTFMGNLVSKARSLDDTACCCCPGSRARGLHNKS